jgi:hypothetical protein
MYWVSPSEIALTGQLSAQAPQATHSELITNAKIDTSVIFIDKIVP